MIILFRKTILFIAIVLLTGCGKSEQQIKDEEKKIVSQKREQIKVVNKKEIADFSSKYNAISGWDTVGNLTYVLQEMFSQETKPISFEGELKDITKTDSSYFLKIYRRGRHDKQNYITQISITKEKFIELIKQLKLPNHSNTGCFIFKVSKIISASPVIKSNSELEGEDTYSYLEYDFDESLLIFKGELIDFYLKTR